MIGDSFFQPYLWNVAVLDKVAVLALLWGPIAIPPTETDALGVSTSTQKKAFLILKTRCEQVKSWYRDM